MLRIPRQLVKIREFACTSMAGMVAAPVLLGGREVESSTGLCNVCREIDFRYIRLQIKEGKDSDGQIEYSTDAEEHSLGYLDEIYQTRECAFCRLVTKAMELSWPEVPRLTLSGERIRCFIHSSDYTFYSQDKSENGSRRRSIWAEVAEAFIIRPYDWLSSMLRRRPTPTVFTI